MTDLIDTVQLQEIEDEFIELFDIILPNGTPVYLFNGLDENNLSITFQGNEYLAIPIQLEGIEISSAGAPSRPTLSVANIPSLSRSLSGEEVTLDSIMRAEGILSNDDFLGTKVTYRTTLASKLSTGEEYPSQSFYIDRVAAEANVFVQFELASPIDVEGVKIPNRVVIGRYCPWEYQGAKLYGSGGCSWGLNEGIFFTEKDTPILENFIDTWNSQTSYSKGDPVKTTTSVTNRVTGETDDFVQIWKAIRTPGSGVDPRTNAYYWKRIDVCGKTLTSCKLRYQGLNQDKTVPLPFGGFPGVRNFK